MTKFSKTINEKTRSNYEQGKAEEQKRILEIIEKIEFGYGSEEGTQDFVSSGILKVMKELMRLIKNVTYK